MIIIFIKILLYNNCIWIVQLNHSVRTPTPCLGFLWHVSFWLPSVRLSNLSTKSVRRLHGPAGCTVEIPETHSSDFPINVSRNMQTECMVCTTHICLTSKASLVNHHFRTWMNNKSSAWVQSFVQIPIVDKWYLKKKPLVFKIFINLTNWLVIVCQPIRSLILNSF